MADALVLTEPRRLERRELSVPEIGDDDALLRVEACGLCGTDHEQFTGVLPAGFSFIPGHETVGVVERIGSDASSRWGVAEGDRVAVEVFMSCRTCDECEAGAYQRCRRHGLRDMYGFISVEKSPGLWGGYASHQYLAPDSIVHKVPASLEPEMATLFNPLGAGVRWGVEVPGTSKGDVVCVLGPGIRGLSVVAATREAGAGFVMVTGAGPNDASRLECAKEFGADVTVDVASQDPVVALREATGGRLADVVVDVTAKAPDAFNQSMQLVRSGGTVVVAGTRGAEVGGFWPDVIVYKEIRILGALGVDSTAYRRALEILADGKYPFESLPRRVDGLQGATSLLQTMAGEGTGPPPVHGVLVPDKTATSV